MTYIEAEPADVYSKNIVDPRKRLTSNSIVARPFYPRNLLQKQALVDSDKRIHRVKSHIDPDELHARVYENTVYAKQLDQEPIAQVGEGITLNRTGSSFVLKIDLKIKGESLSQTLARVSQSTNKERNELMSTLSQMGMAYHRFFDRLRSPVTERANRIKTSARLEQMKIGWDMQDSHGFDLLIKTAKLDAYQLKIALTEMAEGLLNVPASTAELGGWVAVIAGCAVPSTIVGTAPTPAAGGGLHFVGVDVADQVPHQAWDLARKNGLEPNCAPQNDTEQHKILTVNGQHVDYTDQMNQALIQASDLFDEARALTGSTTVLCQVDSQQTNIIFADNSGGHYLVDRGHLVPAELVKQKDGSFLAKPTAMGMIAMEFTATDTDLQKLPDLGFGHKAERAIFQTSATAFAQAVLQSNDIPAASVRLTAIQLNQGDQVSFMRFVTTDKNGQPIWGMIDVLNNDPNRPAVSVRSMESAQITAQDANGENVNVLALGVKEKNGSFTPVFFVHNGRTYMVFPNQKSVDVTNQIASLVPISFREPTETPTPTATATPTETPTATATTAPTKAPTRIPATPTAIPLPTVEPTSTTEPVVLATATNPPVNNECPANVDRRGLGIAGSQMYYGGGDKDGQTLSILDRINWRTGNTYSGKVTSVTADSITLQVRFDTTKQPIITRDLVIARTSGMQVVQWASLLKWRPELNGYDDCDGLIEQPAGQEEVFAGQVAQIKASGDPDAENLVAIKFKVFR